MIVSRLWRDMGRPEKRASLSPSLAALVGIIAAACGARTTLDVPTLQEAGVAAGAAGAPTDAGQRTDGDATPGDASFPPDASAPDVAIGPDLDCPQGSPGVSPECALDVDRICFYPIGAGLQGCRCDHGQWQCATAICDGWGPPCFGSVHDDVCSSGLGCGACCSLGGAPRLATWCACDGTGDRPFCTTDVVCQGP
jgi:hypothetical protein